MDTECRAQSDKDLRFWPLGPKPANLKFGPSMYQGLGLLLAVGNSMHGPSSTEFRLGSRVLVKEGLENLNQGLLYIHVCLKKACSSNRRATLA